MVHTPEQSDPPRRLLIVDDERSVRHLLSEFFSRQGRTVRAAQNGEEAVAIAATFQPELVLLDLLMPGMSGADILRALKQLAPPPKVVMLSGADQEDVVKGALDLGADFYVCKPVDLAYLDRVVRGFWSPTNAHV